MGINPIKIIGTVLKFVTGPLAKTVSTLPKGTATGLGAAVTAGGAVIHAVTGQVLTDQNIVEFVKAIALCIEAVGSIIVGMGSLRHHNEKSE